MNTIENFKIREANIKDAKQLTDLYKILCPDDNVEVLPFRISQFEESNRDYLLVIEVNNVVIGTLTVNICLNAEIGLTEYAIFENLVLLEDYRGKGYGKRLFSYAEEIVQKRKCEKIMILSSKKRKDAHIFLRKIGYSDNISLGFKKYL